MTDVRCPSCNRGARVNCASPSKEKMEAERLMRAMAANCPNARIKGAALPCPFAQAINLNHEPERAA